MSDMMDDINKYAAIWDAAQAKGIFPKQAAPKKEVESEERPDADTDFFGQYLSDDYDMDRPLNEVDAQYWAKVSRLADPNDYTRIVTEAKSKEAKDIASAMGKSHNPIRPESAGKDQEMHVTPNWGVGGKEHFQLEELKVRLEKLESKLNAMESSEKKSGKSHKDTTQDKIDRLKKQIDQLSDSLSGDRLSNDG